MKIKSSKFKKLAVLYPNQISELLEYVIKQYENPNSLQIYFETIPGRDKANLQFWLDSKLRIEGPPPDDDLIEEIGISGIIKPIIIDINRDYTVEGRHRLSAAIEYGIDCPVFIISE